MNLTHTSPNVSALNDERRRRAVRFLGYAAGDLRGATEAEAAGLLREELDQPTRVSLAWAAMAALDRRDAAAIAGQFSAGGYPPPGFLSSPKAEAALWAAGASRRELRAFAAAAFKAMTADDRRAFLGWARRAP